MASVAECRAVCMQLVACKCFTSTSFSRTLNLRRCKFGFGTVACQPCRSIKGLLYFAAAACKCLWHICEACGCRLLHTEGTVISSCLPPQADAAGLAPRNLGQELLRGLLLFFAQTFFEEFTEMNCGTVDGFYPDLIWAALCPYGPVIGTSYSESYPCNLQICFTSLLGASMDRQMHVHARRLTLKQSWMTQGSDKQLFCVGAGNQEWFTCWTMLAVGLNASTAE